MEVQLQDEVARSRLLVTESRDGIVVLNQDCKVVEAALVEVNTLMGILPLCFFL